MCYKNNRLARRICCFFLIFSLLQFTRIVHAEENKGTKTSNSDTTVNISSSNQAAEILEKDYYEVSKTYSGKEYKGEDLFFSIADIAVNKDLITEDKKYKSGKALRLDEGREIELAINVPGESVYKINFDYLINDKNILPTELSFKVNGAYPFSEMRGVVMQSIWSADIDNIPLDRYGNQIVPSPSKDNRWNNSNIYDSGYHFSESLGILLKKGINKITIKAEQGSLYLGDMKLTGLKKIPAYSGVKKVDGNNSITIEAEKMSRRSDAGIRPGSIYNMDVTPYSSYKKVLNVLEEVSFSKGGQKIEYDFEVPASGDYYIGFNYIQTQKSNFPVFRDIYLDGVIPYKEMQNFPFDYTKTYKNIVVSSEEGMKIPVHLEKGKHTIALVVTLENVKDSIEKIDKIAKGISSMALQINKIYGGKLDKYRDFEIDKYIPGMDKTLNEWAEELEGVYSDLHKYNPKVKQITEFESLKLAAKLLRELAEDPNEIPKRMTDLNQGQSSVYQYLSLMVQKLNKSALGLDKIYFYQNEKTLTPKSSVFEKLKESINRFFISFLDKSYAVDYSKNKENLQVWINRPRQYVEIIQEMVDESFTPQTGVKVDISIMPDQNKLVLANASGKSPDVAASINSSLPYDLAVRGALQDLSLYKDFPEVAKRFQPGLLIPGVVDNGIYAVPETFNFWVMFYRKDILNSLNITVPDTMEDVKKILPQLQRRGLNFYSQMSGFIGFKPFAGTMPFIYQNGGAYLRKDSIKTALDTEKTLAGIKEMTEMYTIHNLPYEVQSFYQNFRDGVMPIGISDYGTFNMLTNAAPELNNMWDISLYPGVKNSEGQVERWATGSAESCIIFKNSNKKDAAWEFLKWWTSKEVQVHFGYKLQSTYGNEYMWNSANVEAFKEAPWNSARKKVILEQTKWAEQVPGIPGRYMIEREMSNAFVDIVLNGKNERTAVDESVKRINRELERKFEEFGYTKGGKNIKQYEMPSIEKIKKWIDEK